MAKKPKYSPFDVEGEVDIDVSPPRVETMEAPVAKNPEAPADRPAGTIECSDLRNSERLLQYYGRGLKFVTDWGAWIAWNGRTWEVGRDGAVGAAKRTSRVLYAEACQRIEDARTVGDEKEQERATKFYAWICKSQNLPRITAMVDLASSLPDFRISSKELNADPYMLCVRNGTINLKSGALTEHRPSHHITKIAPVTFDAAATCPTWERFVAESMGGDKQLIAYLQRFIGYALTGSTEEQCLAFFYGDGRNGKSTFLNTIYRMLGAYAAKAPRKFLFESKGDRHPTELVPLFGARMVVCHEIGGVARFDEQLLKDVTGSDPLSARRMHEDNWEFEPTHTLFMYGNEKPRIRGRDEGVWRRIRLIPWTIQISKERVDKDLPRKLTKELPGILNWSIRGCLLWQKDGLGMPAAVEEATEAYREESDPLGSFFRQLEFGDRSWTISKKTMRKAYEKCCADEGVEFPLGPRNFNERLEKAVKTAYAGRGDKRSGVETSVRVEGKVVEGWRGVRLRMIHLADKV